MFQKFTITFLLSISLAASFAQAAPVEEESINKGRLEYEARCMHCHGDKADGKGHLVSFLKITPADLTVLNQSSDKSCVAEKVMKAVLGRHKSTTEGAKMTLLKDVISLEKVYFISEYIKSVQK
ncbi:MAG: hypothetical protein OQL19_14720 [Gammaproteobacteria bacterium]|nr:hypothetical protein [Gammaproteobacteria bacterium]